MRGAGVKLGREFPIVYNGCDFDAYEPSFEPGKYLAFLGRMSPEKNPLDAIRIAQAAGMPIVLAGQPQNRRKSRYFAEKIQPLIDGERVRWIGPVNHAQKNELLRNAAALLFPIQWDEPFGLVMIEAMACGTPVVAHRRGSVEEVVDNGVTGFHSSVIDGLSNSSREPSPSTAGKSASTHRSVSASGKWWTNTSPSTAPSPSPRDRGSKSEPSENSPALQRWGTARPQETKVPSGRMNCSAVPCGTLLVFPSATQH